MSSQMEKFKAIADKIREKKGTTDLIKPNDFASEIDNVYEVGTDKAIATMWKILSKDGTRTTGWAEIFGGVAWTKKTFVPQYPIDLGNGGYNLTQHCPPASYHTQLSRATQVSMIELEEKFGVPIFDMSKVANATRAFVGALFKDWGTIDLSSATNTAYAFYGNYTGENLRPTRIKRLISSESTVWSSMVFGYASEYTSIGFEGVIGQNGLNLKDCIKLDKASLTACVNCLSSTTSGLSVTLPKTAVNNAFEGGETGTEWNTLTGTKTNWTIYLS